MARGPSNSPNRKSPAKKTPAKSKRGTAPARGAQKKVRATKAAKAARGASAKAGRKASKVKGKAKTAATRSSKGASKAPARKPKTSARRAPRAKAANQPQAGSAAMTPAQTQGKEEKGSGEDAPSAIGPRITVLNVNVPGYRTTVDARKYHAMKRTLLALLPKQEPGLTQAEMFAGVRGKLPEDVFPGQDKAEWWVKCVQLDLEARGEMRRASSKPLRWHAA